MSSDVWERVEISLLQEVPGSFSHVPDSETRDFDARVDRDITPSTELPIVGRSLVPEGTIVELKTCQKWIDDAGSGGGRRRGAFFIKKGPHALLLDRGGVYLFVVTDEERTPLASRLVAADEVHPLLTWTNGGRRRSRKRAILSWPRVVEKGEVDQ